MHTNISCIDGALLLDNKHISLIRPLAARIPIQGTIALTKFQLTIICHYYLYQNKLVGQCTIPVEINIFDLKCICNFLEFGGTEDKGFLQFIRKKLSENLSNIYEAAYIRTHIKSLQSKVDGLLLNEFLKFYDSNNQEWAEVPHVSSNFHPLTFLKEIFHRFIAEGQIGARNAR